MQSDGFLPLEPLKHEEHLNALITERLLMLREGLEEDYGLVRVKPKPTEGVPGPASDSDYSLQGGL